MNVMDDASFARAQDNVCERFGAAVCRPNMGLKIGVALQTKGLKPTHGMRIPPENGTEGWYIWAGEYSDSAEFFKPIHISHLDAAWPELLPYLALPPGYRFIIDESGYEDVWFDQILLDR